jgi:hypothetical protein
MSHDLDLEPHHWPEEELTERVEPRRSRYQRVMRFLTEAFEVGMVARSVGSPRNQDPVRNVAGIGISSERSRDANRGSSADD